MLPVPAPLGYRHRVALEKERVTSLMSQQDEMTRAAWRNVRVTRRFALGKDTRLYVWGGDSEKALLGTLSILEASFNYTSGFSAELAVRLHGENSNIIKHATLGRLPVAVLAGVFIGLDLVEPFVQGGDDTHICVIAYSTAGVTGVWNPGVVIGTKEEYENYGVN